MENFLGVVGGVGPLATAYFMERVINLTDAKRDQDHIDMMILNHVKIPDRTAYILGNSKALNPYPFLLQDCKILQNAGAKLIAIPCNTALYFLPQLIKIINIPIVDMIKETAEKLAKLGINKVGIMATAGTLSAKLFQYALDSKNISYFLPNGKIQSKITEIIYKKIKSGIFPNFCEFEEVADNFFANGCEKIILGCTELSMLKKVLNLKENFIDTLDVAAEFIVSFFGKKIKHI